MLVRSVITKEAEELNLPAVENRHQQDKWEKLF